MLRIEYLSQMTMNFQYVSSSKYGDHLMLIFDDLVRAVNHSYLQLLKIDTNIKVEWHWEEVRGPLIVCIWVLIAGLAKIGFHEAHRLR